MDEEKKAKIVANILLPFFIVAVVLNSIWIDIKRPVGEMVSVAIYMLPLIFLYIAVYYWLNGTLPR